MRRRWLAVVLLLAGCGPKALTPGCEAIVYIPPDVAAQYPGLRGGPLDPGTYTVVPEGTKVRYVGVTETKAGTFATVMALDGPHANSTVYVRPEYLKPL